MAEVDLLIAIARHTRAEEDRRHGEFYIACPFCGHSSSPRNPHFSFSARGYFCFVCSSGGSLKHLAQTVGLDGGEYRAPASAPAPSPKRPASWLATAEAFVRRCHTEAAWEVWRHYKPVSSSDFERCRLGLGVLPASACHHPRLIVPIIDGTMIVGLRGRRIACDCAKWLAPGGTDTSLYPLYNQDSLRANATVLIVENPVDALLAERLGVVGVATYSVAYWQERWEQVLIASRPAAIVVAYDNDLPGNGGGERRSEFLRDWQASHQGRAPQSNGIRLANRLISLRLPAHLLPWGRADHKADIGSLILAGGAA